MADIGLPATPQRPQGWINRLASSRGFQRWAARFPLTRGFVRAEGEAIFDLMAGFCHSQILLALVDLRILDLLGDGAMAQAGLARATGVPPERLLVLIGAGVSLGLLKQRGQVVTLTRRAAALTGVPGLAGMIRHHRVLYRDLEDPAAFFRDGSDTELASFWPYVFGAGAADDPRTAATYSQLMADSQVLVAEDTLDAVSLRGVTRLMDVGGGTGAFLSAVGARWPAVAMTLFDLPAVAPSARIRFEQTGLSARVDIVPGSFRDDSLPTGADAISLVRVLYDHQDATVAALLAAVHRALPPRGRLIISEPMTGGDRPQRAGDAYFALYCMAMRTGQARSAAQISALLARAGFSAIRIHPSRRPFVTTVIQAVKFD
jgi:demethylspheroidene O-methyltransferase